MIFDVRNGLTISIKIKYMGLDRGVIWQASLLSPLSRHSLISSLVTYLWLASEFFYAHQSGDGHTHGVPLAGRGRKRGRKCRGRNSGDRVRMGRVK